MADSELLSNAHRRDVVTGVYELSTVRPRGLQAIQPPLVAAGIDKDDNVPSNVNSQSNACKFQFRFGRHWGQGTPVFPFPATHLV
jgi:hypothetical protein